MKHQKILDMVEKFAALSGGTVVQNPSDNDYQVQRDRFQRLSDHFQRNLRAITNEMGGELFLLKERKFDAPMTKMLARVYQVLIDILTIIDHNKPYMAAEKLVHYVLDKPNSAIIDNLDFLAKHHIKQTNVDFQIGKIIRQPTIRSIDALKKLAMQLQEHMAKYPILTPMIPTEIPIGLEKNVAPAFLAGESDETKH